LEAARIEAQASVADEYTVSDITQSRKIRETALVVASKIFQRSR